MVSDLLHQAALQEWIRRIRWAARPVDFAIAALLALAFQSGCGPGDRRVFLPPVSPQEAISIVNQNSSGIDSTLRAVGSVDGQATVGGRKRSFHLDGVLFFRRPCFLRFDLKKLGDTQVLIGANAEHTWVYSRTDNETFCDGEGLDPALDGVPQRPEQFIGALGLDPIDPAALAEPGKFMTDHFVATQVQKLRIVALGSHGANLDDKEYWFDRSDPRLLRRIIMRDGRGRIEMDSLLDDYRAPAGSTSLLPHDIRLTWPIAQSKMHFNIRTWSFAAQVGPASIQFATPRECLPQDTP